MADNADGRVVIDTELDNEGFEQGSDKLRKSVDSMTKSIERMSETAAKGLGNTASIDAFTEKARTASSELADAKENLSGIRTDDGTFNSKALERSAYTAQKSVDRLKSSLQRMAYASTQGFNNTASVLSFSANIDEAEERLREARQELAEFASQRLPTDEYQYTVEQIDKAEKAMLRLYDRQSEMEDTGVDENSRQWQRLQLKIRAAEEEVERYERSADRMRATGTAFVDAGKTEQFREMTANIEEQERALNISKALINQEAIEQARLNVLTAQEKVAIAGNANERTRALRELRAAQAALQETASVSTDTAIGEQTLSGWARFGETLSGSVQKGLKAGVSLVKRFSQQSKGAGGNMQSLLRGMRSFRQMLVSRVKRSFISYLSNTITDSIKALAKFDARFDTSVSNLRNRTSELGANITAAFGGLVRQIEPIITKVIDSASRAVEKLNAVIALIRGESTVQTAVRQTESYAKSLDSTAQASEKAKKAQEKLNATLSSYDEIHKLEADNAADTDSAGDAETEKAVFQNVPVESILGGMDSFGKNIVDRLTGAIKCGDWRGAGAAVADGLNLAISHVGTFLTNAHNRIVTAAGNAALALSGFLDGFDGYAAGQTLAHGINLAIDTANSFLDTFTSSGGFEHLGTVISGGINGVIENLDFAGAAHTLSASFIGFMTTLNTTLENVNWQQLGVDIVDFIAGIDWSGVASSISEGIGAAIGGFGMLMKGIFERLWEKGGDLGTDLFDKYGQITGNAFLDGILAIFMGIGDWIIDNIFSPFAEGIAKAFGIDVGEGEIYETGRDVIAGFFEGMWLMLKDAGKWVKENVFDPIWKAIKKTFGIASPSKETKKLGEYVSEGFLEGIKAKLSAVGTWVKDNIFSPFKNAFDSAFNVVGNKAKSLVESGKSIASGIQSGLSDKWSSVSGFLTEKVGEFTAKGRELVSGLSSGIGEKWETLTGDLSGKFESLKNANIFQSFSGAGEKIVTNLQSGIQEKWDWFVNDLNFDKMSRIVNDFKDRISGDFADAGRSLVDGLNAGIEDRFYTSAETVAAVGGAAAEAFRKAMGISSPSKLFRRFGIWTLEGFEQGIEAETKSAVYSMKNIASGIADEAENIEIDYSLNTAVSGLDSVAGKLSAIAQQFIAIGRAIDSFTAFRVPAVAAGAVVPAKTVVTEYNTAGKETNDTIKALIAKIDGYERALASRPIRVEMKAEIDKREVGRAAAEFNTSANRIGNGGTR